jgi:UDP-glucose 4-epimerase
MNILITGSASHIARACIPVLLEDTRIKKITGIDLNTTNISHPNYQEHIVDIRSEEMARHYAEVDAVIHLAFIVNNGLLGKRRFDRDYIQSVNVAGSQNVFQLAADHKVKTIVHFSSAIVYGASSENAPFIDETQPLKAMSGFYYSEDKVAVEQWLDKFETQNAWQRIVRLRPHAVLGQYAQPLVKSMLKQPFYFIFPDPQPLTQCVSEMDVASAILQSLFSDAHGSFNLATDQVSSFYLIHKHLHSYSIPLPFSLAKHSIQLAWRYTGRFADPAWMDCMRFPLTIDNEKAKRELGWKPTLELFECLDATV